MKTYALQGASAIALMIGLSVVPSATAQQTVPAAPQSPLVAVVISGNEYLLSTTGEETQATPAKLTDVARAALAAPGDGQGIRVGRGFLRAGEDVQPAQDDHAAPAPEPCGEFIGAPSRLAAMLVSPLGSVARHSRWSSQFSLLRSASARRPGLAMAAPLSSSARTPFARTTNSDGSAV